MWKSELNEGKPVFYKLGEDISLFANYFFKNPLDPEKDFVPYAWQDAIFNDKSDRLAICTSRQIGKSTAAALMAIHFAYFNDNATVLVISKTDRQSVEFMDQIKNLMKNSGKLTWDPLQPKEREKMSLVRIKNAGKKSYSRILSLPPTEAARGFSAQIVICDEAAFWDGISEVKDGNYIFNRVISPTVFATKGKMIVISTPNGQQGFFYDLFEGEVSRYWSGYQFDWHASPDMDDEYYARETAGKTSLEIASEYEAEFVSPLAAYFTYDEIKRATVDGPLLSSSSVKVVSADFGKLRDQAVILVGSIEDPTADPKDTVVRVERRIVKPLGTLYSGVMGEIKALYRSENPINIVVDATGVGEGPSEFLQSEGLPVEAVKFSIQKKAQIYSTLKVLFEQGRIKIPNEKQMLAQLGWMMYEYTSNGNIKIYPPVGRHDDEVDALALLAYGLTNALLAPISLEIVEKPTFSSRAEKTKFKGGEKLFFCRKHDDYHWNACSEA